MAVESIGVKPCQCIKVDAPDELYLTNECIVTHNTSFAIAWAELRGYQSVLMVAPRNARIHAVMEFERLGFKRDKDFVVVDSLADLEKPGKYYLVTSTWLRKEVDKEYKARSNSTHLLRPSGRYVRVPIPHSQGDTEVKLEHVHNECPHCGENLVRYVPGKGLITARGYRCVNKDCSYRTDNTKKTGTAFKAGRAIVHTGGYINYELAAHANCPDEKVRARMCPECKTADAVWKPAPYKRLKKLFSAEIADEVHSCKDINSDTAKSTFGIKVHGRQALTGTLISNTPMDAYYPIHWSENAPDRGFPYARARGFAEFDERFCDTIALERVIGEEVNAGTGETVAVTKTTKKRVPFLKNPPDFWRFTSPKIIRRTYDDPMYIAALEAAGMKQPKFNIKKYPCPMDAHQAALMLSSIQDFKVQFKKIVDDAEGKGNSINSALVISQMSTLKILATCPEMLNEQTGKEVYKGIPGGGKMPHIYSLVKSKVAAGGKVVVLSDFIRMQKTCAEALKEFNPIRFRVDWDDDARKEAFEAFQEDHSETGPKVFIAGTRAIKEGSDLSAADTVIGADLLWSPGPQMQSWYRILTPTTRGRECEIYIMISEHSLDEHIYGVFYSKKVAAEQALDRQIRNRRAEDFDVKWFVERVLEEELAISNHLERADDNSTTMIIPELDPTSLEEREI